MKLKAQADKNDPYSMKCIEFDLSTRAFSVYVHMDPKLSICIAYCPFCGAKLPKELIDEKYDIICDELGLDYVPSSSGYLPKKELPEEFKTDEWWRKRGL
ncbi:MAG: hypothetical protein LBF49_02060 [Puniceicoccales bacterium]|jgi:nitrite reductase/ring-hydroxylating ferredoxin subunit|nr:hypothetical protein [Puniceicoccales bacterium]